ncbi:MAG TPA: nucleotidyltransferase domain-containing protein [Candidatus Elarobacter sp.]|nr:nucleotidyltransferase domain-containing protein [Candidatus Elarobacter sp.]HEV2738740.1 nucleotidyltransferase domain-containing protein [Candidatus Elarobacter sp.]
MGRIEDALRDVAAEHGGFFTTQAAVAAGIRRDLIVQLANRGRIERVARGLYRFRSWPAGGLARYHEAVLWAHAQRDLAYAVVSHDSALELYKLAQRTPDVVHVTIPQKTRIVRDTPSWIRFHRAGVEQHDRVRESGVPTVSIARALEDIAPARGTKVVCAVAREAQERRLLHDDDVSRLVSTFGSGVVANQASDRSSVPTLARVLTVLRGQEPVLRRRGIRHAGVFGSVARGDATSTSDIDIVVDIDYATGFDTMDLIEIEERLRHVFGRRVDVVSAGGLKLGKHDGIRRETVRAF